MILLSLQIRFCMSFTYWTSPVVLTVLYRRGYFSSEGLISIGKFAFSISVIYTVAYITRGINFNACIYILEREGGVEAIKVLKN